MYRVDDKIVHPLHGAGTIIEIETQRVDGQEKLYYAVRLQTGNVRILVPVEGCDRVGIRPVVTRERAYEVLAAFPSLDAGSGESWNRRYRENMLRLKSGDLEEVLRVIKGLMLREAAHGLSTGERRMLVTARGIFYSEVTIATGEDAEALEARLYAAL